MRPTEPTAEDHDLWARHDGVPARGFIIGGPEEGPDVIPCPALVTDVDGQRLVRVRWDLDEIELAALAQGGSLWLTCWGGLPIHAMDVTRPSPANGEPANEPRGTNPDREHAGQDTISPGIRDNPAGVVLQPVADSPHDPPAPR